MAQLQRVSTTDPAVDAAGAVDGTMDGGFGFHTDQQTRPWWQVDLGSSVCAGSSGGLQSDGVGRPARTLTVSLSDDEMTWHIAYQHDGAVFFGSRTRSRWSCRCTAPRRDTCGCSCRMTRGCIWTKCRSLEPPIRPSIWPCTSRRRRAASAPGRASRPSAQTPAVVLTDVQSGRRVIRQLLDACGPSAAELGARLEQLVGSGCPLDDQRWVQLFSDARQLEQRWATVRAQWQRVNLEALRLAIRDLVDTYGPRYENGPQYLQQLDGDRAAVRRDRRGHRARRPRILDARRRSPGPAARGAPGEPACSTSVAC